MTLSEEAGAVTCVDIPITDDSIFESVEDFRIEISTTGNDPAVQLGIITIATVLIDDLGEHPIIYNNIRSAGFTNCLCLSPSHNG